MAGHVLGVDAVACGDDLDCLGRDRGSALAFAALFEREFGRTVPISAASSAPAVAQLAVVLGASAQLPPEEIAVGGFRDVRGVGETDHDEASSS